MNKLIMTGAVGALALSALVLAKPAMAGGGTPVFTQTGASTFKFYDFTSAGDKLTVTSLGSYLGTTGTLTVQSTFSGPEASDGTYSSGDALTTFSFNGTTIASNNMGSLYFDTSDPGVIFSGANGYSFVAGTMGTTTSTLPFGIGTKETGSVTDAELFKNAPVPEASTVVSFGALLALGGLAVLRRKSVQNAA